MSMKTFALIGFFFLFIGSAALAYNVNLDIRDEQDYEQLLNLTFYRPGTGEEIANDFAYGATSFLLNDSKMDLEMEYDDFYLTVLVQNLTISNMNKKIVVNDAFPIMEGYNVLKGYVIQLPDLSFSNIVLKINYEDSYVIDESKIQLYKCSSFDFDLLNCTSGWENVSFNIDMNQKIVTANVKSLSVYALAEPEEFPSEETTTTTTQTISPTQTTTQTSPGSSGGSAPDLTTTTTTQTVLPTQTTTTTTQTTTQSVSSTTQTPSEESNQATDMSALISNPIFILAIAVILSGFLFWRWHSGKSVKAHYKPSKRKKYSGKETKLVFH